MRNGSPNAAREALLRQRTGKMTKALRHPPQRTLGVPPDHRLHQRLQRFLQTGPDFGCGLAATAGTAHPPRRARLLAEFRKTAVDRRTRHPRRGRYQGYTAAAERQGFRRHPQTDALLVKVRRQRLEPAPDRFERIHPDSESHFDSRQNPDTTERFDCFATGPNSALRPRNVSALRQPQHPHNVFSVCETLPLPENPLQSNHSNLHATVT